MTSGTPWFRKYWVPHRGRFRYVPNAWQGWAALLATAAAPHVVWLVPVPAWLHPLLLLPISMVILVVALALLFRLAKARSAES